MQVDNRFLDDLARIANGAVGALSGVQKEVAILQQVLQVYPETAGGKTGPRSQQQQPL